MSNAQVHGASRSATPDPTADLETVDTDADAVEKVLFNGTLFKDWSAALISLRGAIKRCKGDSTTLWYRTDIIHEANGSSSKAGEVRDLLMSADYWKHADRPVRLLRPFSDAIHQLEGDKPHLAIADCHVTLLALRQHVVDCQTSGLSSIALQGSQTAHNAP